MVFSIYSYPETTTTLKRMNITIFSGIFHPLLESFLSILPCSQTITYICFLLVGICCMLNIAILPSEIQLLITCECELIWEKRIPMDVMKVSQDEMILN